MNVQTLLRQHLGWTRDVIGQTIAGVSHDTATRELPGSTIGTIGHIYAHIPYALDAMLHGVILGQAPIYHSQGWAERTGIRMVESAAMDDMRQMAPPDPAALAEYAACVFDATDAYLAGASDEEMDRVVDPGFVPPMPAAVFLLNLPLWNCNLHLGEIAALKGVMGEKGLPF
jgi:hypothetical protein